MPSSHFITRGFSHFLTLDCFPDALIGVVSILRALIARDIYAFGALARAHEVNDSHDPFFLGNHRTTNDTHLLSSIDYRLCGPYGLVTVMTSQLFFLNPKSTPHASF